MEELLNAGIAAAKAKDEVKAIKLLTDVVQTDPNSELGWLWLGLCVSIPERREYCFRKVLRINPNNAEARRQIELLEQQAVNSREETETLGPTDEPILQKKQRRIPELFAWLGLGIVMLLIIGVSGVFLDGKLSALRKSSAAANAPTMASTAESKTSPSYEPLFESTSCAFDIPAQARVTCGFVTVPEDRNGSLMDTIQIAVAVYHSDNATPQPDPFLYIQGGPGQLAIDWSVRVYEPIIKPLLGDRDFVIFDPRGVGYSKPSLNCDEIKHTYISDVQGKLPADQKSSYYQGAILTCKNHFEQLGVDPAMYTSANIAADARDVLTALGYQQANLYGVSYGTRIAQLMMREYPENVRSTILDSVVPVESQLLKPDTNTEQDLLLHLLFEDCKADPACASAYPDLESVYNETIKMLDAQPARITMTINKDKTLDQSINGVWFRNTTLWALRSPQTMAAIPGFIYRTHTGDYSDLTFAAALPVITFDSISTGMYVSMNCHDQVFAIPTEGLDATIYDLCTLWGVTSPIPGENDPVNSDIPTLIFAGKYDSVTPPSFAHQLTAHLSHSYLAEIPNQGHAPSTSGISDCSSKVILSFVGNPSGVPDVGCVNESNKIKFVVPYDGSTPLSLEPVMVSDYQVRTVIPTGWTEAGFGFYSRYGKIVDITQIGVQSAAVPEAQWVSWLFTNFQGTQGLDSPAVKYDQHNTNGLAWTIYRTSSNGNPIDIAFAKSGSQTLMVLLFSYQDEHDALYDHLFLPVIDSTKSSK